MTVSDMENTWQKLKIVPQPDRQGNLVKPVRNEVCHIGITHAAVLKRQQRKVQGDISKWERIGHLYLALT